uniref:Uncharacterized protein n=1 Tax=Anopheles minimus TaxID=112268 RepID=A0A182WNM9_9DIPT
MECDADTELLREEDLLQRFFLSHIYGILAGCAVCVRNETWCLKCCKKKHRCARYYRILETDYKKKNCTHTSYTRACCLKDIINKQINLHKQ